MPIIRKVIDLGDSKAITIPKSWIEGFERESGQPVREVAMEVNHALKIEPVLLRKVAADRKESAEK